MNNLKILVINLSFISIILFLNPFSLEAQEKPSSIEERLIRLEEGQKALNQRIDELRDSLRREMIARFAAVDQRFASIDQRFASIDQRFDDMNKRFDDMNKRFDNRFDDINKRFDDLQFWLQLVFGAVVLMFAGLIAQWLLMWRRLIKIETKVEEHLAETEKDRLIALQREEIEMLKARLDKLEANAS